VEVDEPERVAEAVRRLALKHIVITSVTRDDLPDGGAGHIAETLSAIKRANPRTTIEILVQDFKGDEGAIRTVIEAGAEVFSHNIESVASVFPRLRDRRFSYQQSLDVLRYAAGYSDGPIIKSAFMVGCGETRDDVYATLSDLKETGCNAVSIGQYLQPTSKHFDVVAFVTPKEFRAYEEMALAMGFDYAVAGPFVRSSYRSEELLHGRWDSAEA
jgi:lipoic acid synthetase